MIPIVGRKSLHIAPCTPRTGAAPDIPSACGGLLCMDQHGHQGAVPVVADHHAVAAIDGTTQGKFLEIFRPTDGNL